jgi:serine/threonine-protein kinase RsbW
VWLDLTLRLPREPETVAVGRRTVECALMTINVPEQDRRDVALAVSEACTNVVQHAGPVRGYTISVVAEDDRCMIDVADDGPGVEAAEVHRYVPAPSAERGRGLPIIHAVMDGVQIASGPAGGLIIRMVKRLMLRGESPSARQAEKPSDSNRGD